MFLQHPAETAEVDRLYQGDVDSLGYVMNLMRLWAWRPDVFEAFSSLRSQLTPPRPSWAPRRTPD